MIHLIKSWHAEASRINKAIRADKAAGRDTSTLKLIQRVYQRCAKELASADTFKFCVGDEVTVIESGFVGVVTGRTEHFEGKKFSRVYSLLNMFLHYEDELQHHRSDSGQARKSSRDRS